MLVILRSLISSNEVTAVKVLEVYLKIYSDFHSNDETTKNRGIPRDASDSVRYIAITYH